MHLKQELILISVTLVIVDSDITEDINECLRSFSVVLFGID
jgi:hypothetical protein